MFSFSSRSKQLVAQAGEHDAADEGARHGRVEDVRVLGQADTQRLGLGLQTKPATRATAERVLTVNLLIGTLPEGAEVSH
jgi:hypothetical protein